MFVLLEPHRQMSTRRPVSGAEDADTVPGVSFSFHMSLQSWLNIIGDIRQHWVSCGETHRPLGMLKCLLSFHLELPEMHLLSLSESAASPET